MPWTAIQNLDPFCSNKLWKNTWGSIHVTGTLLHHGKATDHLESLQQAAKSRKGTTVLRLAEDSLRPGRKLWQFADKPIFASIFDKIFCFHLFSILIFWCHLPPEKTKYWTMWSHQFWLKGRRKSGNCSHRGPQGVNFRWRLWVNLDLCSLFFRWSLLKQEAKIGNSLPFGKERCFYWILMSHWSDLFLRSCNP